VPGVVAAGSAVTLPIGGDDFGTGFVVEGRPPLPAAQTPQAGYQIVMPGYFAAMGIPLRAGRDFRASDNREAPPVVLVNETLAKRQWPGEDPIGRRVRFDDGGAWMTVIGVVADIRHLGPAVPPRPELYQAVPQRSFPFMAFVVRTDRDAYAALPSIRRALGTLDPDMPLANVKTMDEHIAHALSRPKFLSGLIVAFGAVAVMLAVVGIYGMMAWLVSERRREFAIRMALGARGGTLIGLVLRKGLLLALIGIGGGLAGARATTGVLSGLLVDVRPTDPGVFALTAGTIALVALAACYIPARRALRVDPASLLR